MTKQTKEGDRLPESELLQEIRKIFLERIPFNKVIGMKLETLTHDDASLRIDMRPELVGNFVTGVLHGGVISSVLDVMGGMIAFLSIINRMQTSSADEKFNRLSKFGTIDLRVDFLRPGKGNHFIATGTVLRTGNRVAVTRMELHNDQGVLVALGTGTYAVV